MKMTMHIDEKLLKNVMEAYEIATKTEAVEMALKEMDRRTKLKHYAKHGLGLTPEQLRDAVDPNYDIIAMRNAGIPRYDA